MKNILARLLTLALTLMLVGCGAGGPPASQPGAEVPEAASAPVEALEQPQEEAPSNSDSAELKSLPVGYPEHLVPLAPDAEIVDVKQNPANHGLEIIYVSDHDIDALYQLYEGALQGADNLSVMPTQDGFMFIGTMQDVGVSVMLSKDIMKAHPLYANKMSVYLVLTGLTDMVSGEPQQMPEGEGEAWPASAMPGVPELKGYIGQVLKEDGVVRLEITVESADVVKSYLNTLKATGFSFDTTPDPASDYMEFLAFKDSGGMMSFAYQKSENFVTIDYQP